MIEYSVKVSGDSEVAKAIGESVADIIAGRSSGKNLAPAAMKNIVKRSLGKAGSTLRQEMVKGMRQGTLGYPDRATYPGTGWNISRTLAKYRPFAEHKKKITPVTGQTTPGGKLVQALRFNLSDDSQVETGLISVPGGKGAMSGTVANLWRKRFADWQEEGEIDYSIYPNANKRAMFAYFRALGMPITRVPRRPARPVISTVEQRHNPSALFEKFFVERLNR